MQKPETELTPAEARYLELASRPGMEALRRECPDENCDNGVLIDDDIPFQRRGERHKFCQGRGWLPLPEAEQMGALVRLSQRARLALHHYGMPNMESLWWVYSEATNKCYQGEGPTPEAALVEALLAVQP